MANLTKEYFDKALDKKLKTQTKELKDFTVKQVDHLALIVARHFEVIDQRFDRLEKKMDETKELKIRIEKIEQVLNIRS